MAFVCYIRQKIQEKVAVSVKVKMIINLIKFLQAVVRVKTSRDLT